MNHQLASYPGGKPVIYLIYIRWISARYLADGSNSYQHLSAGYLADIHQMDKGRITSFASSTVSSLPAWSNNAHSYAVPKNQQKNLMSRERDSRRLPGWQV